MGSSFELSRMSGLQPCATWDGYVSVGCIAMIFLVIVSEECSKVSMGGFLRHACSSSLGQESLYIPRGCDMCFGNSYHACVEQFIGTSLFDVP